MGHRAGRHDPRGCEGVGVLEASGPTGSPVRFTVLGGYLGAGKTTLLNRLLSDNQGVRIALLINDFGAINIDAELIDTQTDQQINLTNGCVCCGLSDGCLLYTSPSPRDS